MELFKIFGTIALKGKDAFGRDVDDATGKGNKLASSIGKGLATAAKVGAAALTAVSGAVGVLMKNSIENYAEYEQLVGGVETLFKDSAAKVQAYAAEAYKTAGLSANDYMSTVTSFSASLLQSLGGDTEAATEYANMAITDMSDNANKMGSSMESIQNAYQGFAKQNYTMLDNLKLGYGGTQEEMKRLIADAAKLSDTVDAQDMSFANIVEAIHVVQTEMGITGTTAAEASSTISGSISSMKAAWTNLSTGLADDNADMEALIGDFVDSATTAAQNIAPRITQVLGGISQLVTQLAPLISSAIPVLITQILPQMLSAGMQILQSLLQGIQENTAALAEGALSIISMLATSLTELLPDIIIVGTELLLALINGIAANPEGLVDTAITLIFTLAEGLISALPQIAAAGISLIAGLIVAIIEKLPDILQTGKDLVIKAAEGIDQTLDEVIAAGGKVVQAIIDGIAGAWDSLKTWFQGVWDSLFGNLSVNVGVKGNSSSPKVGKFATGLDYVPYDEFPALLHKGEAVLTAEEAAAWRAGRLSSDNGGKASQGSGVTIIQNITAVAQTPVELAASTAAYFEQARWAI